MKLFQAYYLLICLSLTATSTSDPIMYAKPRCKDTCGDVKIPYPFGIGEKCSLNKWYTVNCNSSTPYLSAFNKFEVLNINLGNQTVTVNVSMISDCRNPVRNSSQIMNVDLGGSPFLFSRLHNKFVVEGCGNAIIYDHGIPVTGCSNTCPINDTISDKDKCLGVSCCQTTIPHYLQSYTIDLTDLETRGEDGACGSAFLVEKNSYVEGMFSRQSIKGDDSYVPLSLLWTLSYNDFNQQDCCDTCDKANVDLGDRTSWNTLKVDLGNGTSIVSGKCNLSPEMEGNPYLSYGYTLTAECASCKFVDGGSCEYNEIYDDDGRLSKSYFNCSSKSITSSSNKFASFYFPIIGASIIGVLLVMDISYYSLYKLIKNRKVERQRRRCFTKNGGLLLKQQQEADPSLVGKTILFTSHELEKATDNFNENRILGRGGQGIVYKGMLVDGRIVAIKKSNIVDESQLEQFINEVVILSQVNHRNVVKLLGCCLETEVPLLVSEFISNGTLYEHIHNEVDEFPLSLNMRLQIATDVVGALAYLHSATFIPIYHRDIKTTNILLDDKYSAKVSDFGTSRFVSLDQTHLTTLVKGTFGYLDPEYFQSSQFTEKSDVYSFGVVLVELLTGERPISLTRFGENRSLAVHFKMAMEERRVMSIFDAKVIKEGTRDELLLLANLAMGCLNMKGKNRPTMKEVAIELETIRISHIPTTVNTNMGQVLHGEDLSMLTYAESSSTFLSSHNKIIM